MSDRLFCPSFLSRMSRYHCLNIQRSFEFCIPPSSTIPKESHRVSPKHQSSQGLPHLHSTHFLASFKSTQSSPSHPGPVEMTPGKKCKEKKNSPDFDPRELSMWSVSDWPFSVSRELIKHGNKGAHPRPIYINLSKENLTWLSRRWTLQTLHYVEVSL